MFILWMGLMAVLLSMLVILMFNIGYAQDFDQRYACLYNEYPFNEMCSDQKFLDFLDKYYNWTEYFR